MTIGISDLLAHSSYHRVPSSPGITHRPSAATRPISMPSYPVHDALSGSQVLMDVITLSGPHAEPGAGGSALAMAVLKPSVSVAAAAKTSERVASNMIDTSGRMDPTSSKRMTVPFGSSLYYPCSQAVSCVRMWDRFSLSLYVVWFIASNCGPPVLEA